MNRKRGLAAVLLCAGAAGVLVILARKTSRPGADEAGVTAARAAAFADDGRTAEAAPKAGAEGTGGEPRALHGLRLLADDKAAPHRTKTASAPESDGDRIRRETRAKWTDAKIDVKFTDELLETVVQDVAKKTGLPLRIDPALDASEITVTMKVEELAADQALTLILLMADVAWSIDANGDAWVTSKDRVSVYTGVDEKAARIAKFNVELLTAVPSKEDLPAIGRVPKELADKVVSAEFLHKPLREVLGALEAAAETRLHLFGDAEKAVDEAPVVSLIKEGIRLEDALKEVLATSGLTVVSWGASASIWTQREADEWVESLRRAEASAKEWEVAVAHFRARTVSIKGDVLTLADVAAQVSAQTGTQARIECGPCGALWESDGLEQSLGEVLDRLASDGGLKWCWSPEIDPDTWMATENLLWFVKRGE